jgi:hypothetical protein
MLKTNLDGGFAPMYITVDSDVENAVNQALETVPFRLTEHARELVTLAMQAQVDEPPSRWSRTGARTSFKQ